MTEYRYHEQRCEHGFLRGARLCLTCEGSSEGYRPEFGAGTDEDCATVLAYLMASRAIKLPGHSVGFVKAATVARDTGVSVGHTVAALRRLLAEGKVERRGSENHFAWRAI